MPAVEVTENVVASQPGNRGAAIHKTADDGLAAASIVGILHDWEDQPCAVTRVTGRIAVGSFHGVPAEIAALGDDVHFFETVLTDIGGEECAAHSVKRKAPRIAQTVSPDLWQAVRRRERIISGDRVLFPGSEGAIHIDSKDLAKQRLQVLSIALRVSLVPTVAEADVEETIRPESELAAIVIVEGLVDDQEGAFAGSIRLVSIRSGDRVLGEHRPELLADTLGVIDEEAAIRAEAGMKCQPEQPFFSTRFDFGTNVEKRRGDESAILNNANASRLLEDKHASRAVIRNFDPDRRGETVNKCGEVEHRRGSGRVGFV